MDVSIPSVLSNVKVADLVGSNDDWNFQLLTDWMPDQILQRLLWIKPPSINEERT